MSIQQINPNQAKEILDQDLNAVYVDVRSIPEFIQGHAQRAINIPLFHKDEKTQQMIPNPDFTKVAQTNLPKNKPLVVGCMMGGRSQKACEALEKAGYQKLYNVQGGFGGRRDAMGQTLQPGWKELGLPVSQENGEGVGYESLIKKAN